MKRRTLRGLRPGSAAYVVAHAKRRAKRGGRKRNPAVPYLGILNAQEALRVATEVMEVNQRITGKPSFYNSFREGLEEVTPRLFDIVAGPGSSIDKALDEAKDVADRLDIVLSGVAVRFSFNGVLMHVCGESDTNLLYRDWRRARRGCLGANAAVGPHSKEELSREELANDARIRAHAILCEQERQRQREAEDRVKRQAVEARLEGAGPIELADEAGWNDWVCNPAGAYSSGIRDYAERWARLMQIEMAAGTSLDAIADRTSDEADLENMSGHSHFVAVVALVRYWSHGKALRRWHNSEASGCRGHEATGE